MKKIIAIIAVVLMLSAVFTACGSKDEDTATADSSSAVSSSVATPDEAVPETTAVVENTEDGGTIEKDSEDNKIELSKSGEIVSIKDKDGGNVVITEYLTTHYIIASNGKTYGSPEANSPSSKSGSSSKSNEASSKQEKSSSSASGKEEKNEASSSKEEEPEKIVEPTIVMDEYELPVI